MKVYIHTPSWNISSKNTDLRLRKVLASMQERFPEVSFYIPKFFWAGLTYNLKFAINSIVGRICRKIGLPIFHLFDMTFTPIYLPEFKKFKPDVIISQGTFPKNTHNTPVIWEIFFIDPFNFRGGDNLEKSWIYKMSEYNQIAKSAAILGVRDYYSIDLIQKLMPEHALKARFLPFYLPDLEPLDETVVKEKHGNCEKLKLLFVGGQAIRKGLPELIEAVRIVKQKTSKDFQLTVVSAMADGKINIPTDLPIVHFPGLSHSKVMDLFKESHIYVMPSKHDSFGISYIEGLANGCAVIARDFQPQRDMMDDGQSGFLVPPDDISVIAQTIVDLCENEEKRIIVAINGLTKFRNNYYWPIVAQKWIDVFGQIKMDEK